MMKLQPWLLYGVLAAFFWGSYIVAAKIATSQKYYGIDPSHVSLLMLFGIAAVFVGSSFLGGGFEMPQSKAGMGFAILAGALWALGMVVSLRALVSGADIAKLVPVYNTNTLIAVVLGVILFKELPESGEMLKVLAGAGLVMGGAVLVS